MGCQRIHTASFHFADPVADIALESVKEVEEGCPRLAWVGGILDPPSEI